MITFGAVKCRANLADHGIDLAAPEPNMKRNATSKPSISPEQMAAAPERVEDPDCPYEPNEPAAVAAYWQGAITSHGLAELRETRAARRRGPGRAAIKVSTTIRLSPEVLAAFRADGPGWQTLMDNALRLAQDARQRPRPE
ncbi:BrnA antitoxin family protein [Candidatus Thiodictyon syntrophicum]|jgi:uncharacterized protein (DUF4415 family)|uniref:BrnA antitoxin family protein n=1 Tax=Candidatus Thiodictyon syntrophicum TaxID=1166950 RepID=UPI001F20C2EF|nr:BrnA antitoxin family protein [Candidatus Thiodictyon syntrophicum]